MSITKNRLASESNVKLTSTNYISSVDRTKDSPPNNNLTTPKSNKLKELEKIGKTGLYDTINTNVIDPILNELGLHPNKKEIGCGGLNRLTPPTYAADDRFADRLSTVTNCSPDINDILTHPDKLINDFAKLGDAELVNLEKMLTSEINNLANITNDPVIKTELTAMVSQLTTELTNKLNGVSGVLRDKISLKTKLSCGSSGGRYSPGDLKSIKNAVLTKSLKGNLCASIDNMLRVLDAVLRNSDYSIVDVTTSLLSGFTEQNSETGVRTVSLLTSVLKLDSVNRSNMLGVTKPMVGTVLAGISSSDSASVKNPTKLLEDVGELINAMGYSHKNDGVATLTNNTFMKNIAVRSLRTNTNYVGGVNPAPHDVNNLGINILMANLDNSKIPDLKLRGY